MARNYQFNIEIKFFNTEKTQSILNKQVNYPLSKTYKDHFLISNKTINIKAYRNRKIDLNSIFLNYTSALNRQITKALSYYYCALGEAKRIKSIEITRLLNGVIQQKKTIMASELNQVVEKNQFY
jgi:hypothetical protein